MATNGALPFDHKQNSAKQKLISTPQNQEPGNGSPEIKIRTPGAKSSRSKRTNSIRLKRFDLISEDVSPHEAAKEGNVKILKDLKKNGENLEEKDMNGFTPIHHAARANQTDVIEFLLDSGADSNATGGSNELTPLHISVRYNSIEATKLLLSRGSDPCAKTTDGTSSLHFAARHGALDFAELLLADKRSDVNAPDNSGVTAFHLACASGNAKICEIFLDHEADSLATTAEGRNALHIAAASGHVQIVETLIQAETQQTAELEQFVNGRDFEDNTPLHLACKHGHVDTVEVCLRHDADMDARNDIVCNTALHVAAQAGQVNVVETLIIRGASVQSVNAYQRLPIHLASLFGHCDVIKCLLKKGSPVDPLEDSGLTPFLCAVKTSRVDATKLLIESGADTSLRTESLQTCIHLAVQNKNMDVLQLLVDTVGPDTLEVGEKNNRVPLHQCAYSGNIKILEFLLSKGAKPSPKDVFEKTPLHMAAETGNMACVKALVGAAPLHINDTDDTNTTPLHVAAMKGHHKVCKYLLRNGAEVTAKDSNRWTALHHAASSGHVRTVDTLLMCNMVGSDQIIDAKDSKEDTPLIIAAKNGRVDVVRSLMEQNAEILICNKRGMTCLDEAVKHGQEAVTMEIVSSERWYDVLRHRPLDDKYPMRDLIENMPKAAEVVMDRCIKYSELPPSDPEYWIEFDFWLLHSDKNEKKLDEIHGSSFFAPTTMVENRRESLISHPLTETYLLLKWNSLGKPMFWLNLSQYVIFTCLFTSFLVERRKTGVFYNPGDNKTASEEKRHFETEYYSITTPVILTIFISFHMMKEVYQIYSQRLSYLYHLTNFLEWGCYVASLLFMIPHLGRSNVYVNTGVLWPVAAFAVLLMYANLILYLRRIEMFGMYISMYIEVLRTMSKVLGMFSLFIIAFALTFYTLLKEQEPFETLEWSFVKTSMMMIGDISYDSIITDSLKETNPKTGAPYVPVPHFTVSILLIFCFLMPVLLMNLLIGLAVGDIDAIRKNATLRRKAMEVEFIATIDERWPRLISRFMQTSVLIIKPNQKDLKSLIKFNGFEKIATRPTFQKTRTQEQRSELQVMAAEMAEQKTHMKKLQSTIGEQNKLLSSIVQQIRDMTGVTGASAQVSIDRGHDSNGSINTSMEDVSYDVPPTAL